MTESDPTAKQVNLAGQVLKAVANPLRVRMFNLLRSGGPSTATRLGQQLGESSGVTSYHLRQLEAAGLVVDDVERSDGRERWWRVAFAKLSLDAPAMRASMEDAQAYMYAVAAEEAVRVTRWIDGLSRMPDAWERSGDMSSFGYRLTAEQAAELVVRLRTIAEDLQREQPDEPPAGAERVVLQFQVMPFLDQAAS